MKYALILVLALALALPFAEAKKKHNNQGGGNGGNGGNGNHGRKPTAGILNTIKNYVKNNATASADLVAALQGTSLSSKVLVNGNTVNYTALRQYFFTAIPLLQSFINNDILSVYPDFAPTVTATISIINGLKNDATNQTIFAGVLISQGYVSLTSGTVPTLVVHYDLAQANAKTAEILNRFIEVQVQGCVKRGSMGPFGPFKNNKKTH